ncbi:UBP-type zinc finger domain-containing protein [Streptomyces sp. NPDC048577]|uniref:UBP-type zinc finger domain-containing protein n=1 Tax=Streptomyces sp. NPDC048577 TaxID=3157209 RepID=UPI003443A1D1
MSSAAHQADDAPGPPRHPAAWTVATDGGRPRGRTCAHAGTASVPTDEVPRTCGACVRRGWSWVRLRWCATCGHVGCCDSSRGAHAYAHHLATGHPVAVSLASDEEWAWCFPDEVFLVRIP